MRNKFLNLKSHQVLNQILLQLEARKIEIVKIDTKCKNEDVCFVSIVASKSPELDQILDQVNTTNVRLRELPVSHKYKEILLSMKGKLNLHIRASQLIKVTNHLTNLIKQHNKEIDYKINSFYINF